MREEIIEVLHFGIEIEIEWEGGVVGEVINFGEDVDVWEIHLKHGAEGEE